MKRAQRREILAAALDLFSRKGYRDVSMAQIAGKSEFAIGTLYKFFRNKEDLYNDLLLEIARTFTEEGKRIIGGPGDEVARLRRFVRAKAAIFRANAPMIRLYFSEANGTRDNPLAGFHAHIREMREEFLGRVAAVFESGMRRRRFRRIAEPYHLAVALEGLTNHLLFLWLDDPGRHASLGDPEVALSILFKGLLS